VAFLLVTFSPLCVHMHYRGWVYDNGVLVNEKPFTTFAAAMEAIGYSPTSVAGRRTIDTGKAVGGRYTFYSSPKSPRS
jgi:hypothetical protein